MQIYNSVLVLKLFFFFTECVTEILLKCVPHVQHAYLSSKNRAKTSSLFATLINYFFPFYFCLFRIVYVYYNKRAQDTSKIFINKFVKQKSLLFECEKKIILAIHVESRGDPGLQLIVSCVLFKHFVLDCGRHTSVGKLCACAK